MLLYHGSDKIIRAPKIDGGRIHNDYGQGFYCTKHMELAKEWAVSDVKDGFVNSYELDDTNLNIINLNNGGYSILHWLTLLLDNRTLKTSNAIAIDGLKYLKDNYGPLYDEAIMNAVNSQNVGGTQSSGGGDAGSGSDEDDLLDQAVNTVIEAGNASVSILQRRLGIGYPRAARLIDVLEQRHIIGPFEGSKPRKVLINKTDWLEMQSKGEQ